MTERETTAERGAFDRVRNGFRRLHARMHRNRITGLITKVVVTGVGVLVIGAGLVMMVTPGPGIVGIIVGLGILSTEWHWAERLMHSMKEKAKAAADHARELDPAVRRRRLLLTTLAVVVVVGGLLAYVWVYDWPGFAISGWDWLQGISGVVPELPGM